MPDSYTEEEINQLPQTDTVFDVPALVMNEHNWRQEGYMIHDVCDPSTGACQSMGIPIQSGKMLVKDKKKGYELVDEVTRK